MTWIFRATPNASKSHTIQKMLGENTQSVMHRTRIDKSETRISLYNKF